MTRQAFLVGGGIGSLAAAAFLIRDGGFKGGQVLIFEAGDSLGGALDAGGSPGHGYSMRGGRMLTLDNYECTWGLFRSIPSRTDPNLSVHAETVAFNESNVSCAQARLVDRRRAIVPVASMGFSMADRLELLKLVRASEQELGDGPITQWLSPAFFETNFWFMWATTFAFQPWHSALEFHRYLHRFLLEFSRIETLGGVRRTVYNQYDSMVVPLRDWLVGQGVRIETATTVTGLMVADMDGGLVVTQINTLCAGAPLSRPVASSDLVFLQNGSMTDSSSLGSMSAAPAKLGRAEAIGWDVWEALARDRPGLGRPAAFNTSIAQSCWCSFTVTLRSPGFFDRMTDFTGNTPGTGGLVTFRDSRWLLSVVLPHQPHFVGQPADVEVFWGYVLHYDRIGDFVAKPFEDCNGEEILTELCGHLRFEREAVQSAICIPCRMPYITSMFMPRGIGDRPPPVPKGSRNLGFISQFVEIADDVVFTVEYSVRVAQTAVYGLLNLGLPIPPVTRHDHEVGAQFDALIKAFR